MFKSLAPLGFSDYQINEEGVVIGKYSKKLKQFRRGPDGIDARYIHLFKDKRKTTRSIRKLVREMFPDD